MITKKSKWLVGMSVLMLLVLSVTPAFAMPERGDFMTKRSARPLANTSKSAPAATPGAAPQTTTVAVEVSPAAPAQPEDRSVQTEAEKPQSEKPEAEQPKSAQPEVSALVTAPEAMPAPAPQSDPAASQQLELEHGPEVEFKGTVESMTSVSLVVSGRLVTVTAQTVFLDTIIVGNFVEVDGYVQPDQAVVAKTIKLDDNPLVELEVEFRGAITSLPNNPNWLGVWGVGQNTVLVDANTQIDTRRGQPAIGAIAEVKAARQPDNSLLAVRIKVEDANEFQNEIEFKGTISNLTGSSMMVAGHLVTTDVATVISGTLANGALVEVHGALQPDNSVLAISLHVEDPINDEVEFTAHVTVLPANFVGTWKFDNGKTVTADASTLIDQSQGAAQVGALAQVKALKQLDGTWLAVRIQVEDN